MQVAWLGNSMKCFMMHGTWVTCQCHVGGTQGMLGQAGRLFASFNMWVQQSPLVMWLKPTLLGRWIGVSLLFWKKYFAYLRLCSDFLLSSFLKKQNELKTINDWKLTWQTRDFAPCAIVITLWPRTANLPRFIAVILWTLGFQFCCSLAQGGGTSGVAKPLTVSLPNFFCVRALHTNVNAAYSMGLSAEEMIELFQKRWHIRVCCINPSPDSKCLVSTISKLHARTQVSLTFTSFFCPSKVSSLLTFIIHCYKFPRVMCCLSRHQTSIQHCKMGLISQCPFWFVEYSFETFSLLEIC